MKEFKQVLVKNYELEYEVLSNELKLLAVTDYQGSEFGKKLVIFQFGFSRQVKKLSVETLMGEIKRVAQESYVFEYGDPFY